MSARRDTNEWYEGQDALSVVDPSLVDLLRGAAGPRVLDVGCGLGGYSAILMRHGHACKAIDINPRYVAEAVKLGVDASVFDGQRIPLPDKSVDTTFAIEVLEHVSVAQPLLAEIRRVTRRNFIATVPNCRQPFQWAGVVYEHMLDQDHRHFFTRTSLEELLRPTFDSVTVSEIVPVDGKIAAAFLPRPLSWPYRAMLRAGLLRPRNFFRLLAECRIGP